MFSWIFLSLRSLSQRCCCCLCSASFPSSSFLWLLSTHFFFLFSSFWREEIFKRKIMISHKIQLWNFPRTHCRLWAMLCIVWCLFYVESRGMIFCTELIVNVTLERLRMMMGWKDLSVWEISTLCDWHFMSALSCKLLFLAPRQVQLVPCNFTFPSSIHRQLSTQDI
jgi:hypothetical protein